MPRSLSLLPVLLLAACAPAATRGGWTPGINDAETLVQAMHDRYAETWYRTISFTQATTRVSPDGVESTETWREWGSIPGKLRIEMGPEEEQRGVLFSGDSIFVFQGGRLMRRTAQRNPLMLLGFDVYRQPVETSLEMMTDEGFDLSRFHRATWQGRPAYVVGAAEGDSTSKQFWIDAERLVFVRMLEPSQADGGRVADTRFNRYERAGGGWVAPEVEVWVQGRRVFHEVYSDVRVDIPLHESLFDPARWTSAVK